MGLIADIEAASRASTDLEENTRKQVATVDDLQQLLSSNQNSLSLVVESSDKTLQDMAVALAEMDTVLTASFLLLNDKTSQLDGRVSSLRGEIMAELDTNQKAVSDLLPQVQHALEVVEKGVNDACQGLKDLVEEDARLVKEAETQADQAEARAQAVLKTVQAQRQDLQAQAGLLTASWDQLNLQVDNQLKALEEAFAAANQSLATGLKTLLAEVGQAASQSDDGVHAEVMAKTTQELEALALTLVQALTDLKKSGDRPKKLAEVDQADLIKKLKSIQSVLCLIDDNIYKKAQSNGLFDY